MDTNCSCKMFRRQKKTFVFLRCHGSSSSFISSLKVSTPVWSTRSVITQQAIRHLDPQSLCLCFSSLCTPVLDPSWALGLMVVTDRQHQRNEAAQHQSSHLHLAQSFPSVSSCGSVAVAAAADLREDVDGGHVEEGAGREEHGDACGVEVWQGLFAALRGEETKTVWGRMCEAKKRLSDGLTVDEISGFHLDFYIYKTSILSKTFFMNVSCG